MGLKDKDEKQTRDIWIPKSTTFLLYIDNIGSVIVIIVVACEAVPGGLGDCGSYVGVYKDSGSCGVLWLAFHIKMYLEIYHTSWSGSHWSEVSISMVISSIHKSRHSKAKLKRYLGDQNCT